jgi:hypothetical protein
VMLEKLRFASLIAAPFLSQRYHRIIFSLGQTAVLSLISLSRKVHKADSFSPEQRPLQARRKQNSNHHVVSFAHTPIR